MYAYIYAIAYMCVCIGVLACTQYTCMAWLETLACLHVLLTTNLLSEFFRSFSLSSLFSLSSFATAVAAGLYCLYIYAILCFCVARAWALGQRLFLRRPFSWAGHISTFMGSVTSTNAFAALVCFYCCSFHIILVTISFHRTIKQ